MLWSQEDEKWMRHALRLSLLAQGKTAPNPMVGAVLVYNGKIIGQGWHQKYGEAHAEVNCIQSVAKENQAFIKESIMYVTLEPCNHFGKTPPCSQLLIQNKIKKVVIACTDSFEKVNGSGIQALRAAGIETVVGCLEATAKAINQHFFIFHQKQRPFITLKWASSLDHKIGSGTSERWSISNAFSQRWTHLQRSLHQAILVGANTVNQDLPALDNRFFPLNAGPIKIVLDRQGIVNINASLFHQGNAVLIFTENKNLVDTFKDNKLVDVICSATRLNPETIAQECFRRGIQSIFIEGGLQVLQSWIDARLWDEAVMIATDKTFPSLGVAAPQLHHAITKTVFQLDSDRIHIFVPHGDE